MPDDNPIGEQLAMSSLAILGVIALLGGMALFALGCAVMLLKAVV